MATESLLFQLGGDSAGLGAAIGRGVGFLGNLNQALLLVQRTAGAVADALLAVVRAGDEIGDAADRVGVTAEAYQRLAALMKPFGVSAEVAGRAAQKLGVALESARKAGSPAADTLARLGLRAADLSRMSPDAQIVAIAEAMERLPTAGARSAAAMTLFGRAGLEIVGPLHAGGEALREVADAAESAGYMSDGLVRKTSMLADQMALAGQAASALRARALEPLLPVVYGLTSAITEMMVGLRQTDGAASAMQALADIILTEWVPAFAAAAEVVERFTRRVVAAARIIKNLGELTDPWAMVKDVATGGVGKAMEGVVEDVKDLNDGWEDLTGNLDAVTVRWSRFIETAIRGAAAMRRASAVPGVIGDSRAREPSEPTGATEAAVQAEDPFQQIGTSYRASMRAVAEAGRLTADAVHASARTVAAGWAAADAAAAEAAAAAARAAAGIAGAVSSLLTTIGSAMSQHLSQLVGEYSDTMAEIESMEQARADATSAIDRRLAGERSAVLEEMADAERTEILRTFRAGQAAAIATAVIQGALGIASIWGSWGAQPIVAAILTGIEAAAVGIQIGVIASQKPPVAHSGRYIGPEMAMANSLAAGVTINALPGEAVLNRAATEAIGGREGVDAMNRGRRGGNVQPVYQVWDRRVIGVVFADLARTRAPQFRSGPPVGRALAR